MSHEAEHQGQVLLFQNRHEANEKRRILSINFKRDSKLIGRKQEEHGCVGESSLKILHIIPSFQQWLNVCVAIINFLPAIDHLFAFTYCPLVFLFMRSGEFIDLL